MSAVAKVKEGIGKVRTYWRTPPLDHYMTYKEIVSLAGGGIGVKFIITFVQGVLVSVGNVFIGNTIGIKPGPMYAIYVISILASFPLTGLRANIIDNTRNRKGKYRPYIISMGLPTVILSIGYVWAPYEIMGNFAKYATVLFFNIGFQFFYNFLYDAYDNYVVVLSSNSQERANVAAIRAVTDSFAPTLTNAIIPLMGKVITGGDNLFDMRIYRYVWPPILIIGFLISLIIYVNTKEKIIQARTHIVQIKFVDAFRAVFKNKYFWIIAIAGWLGFLEGMAGNIIAWLYSYQHACSPGVYTVLIAIYGNASLWGMLLAPLAIKKIGKRNTLIITNLLNILFISLIYPVVKHSDPSAMIWLVMGCLWLNAVVGSFSHILTPSVNGDIRDYQQYVTGERIDGMFAAVGLIGSFVTMATTSIQSFIYSKVGFNDAKFATLMPKILASGEKISDRTNVYNVLYDRDTFISILGVLIITAVIGAAMNVIPYFFYDLSEVKQRGMVKVLQIRALFEDYGKNALRDKDLVKAIDLVRESREYAGSETLATDKHSFTSFPDKKSARKARAKAIEHNNMISISQFVIDEMKRFDTPQGHSLLEEAKKTVDSGFESIYSVSKTELAAAKVLPTGTTHEKEFRKAEIQRIRDCLYAQRIARKHFPNGIEEFDNSEFDTLFAKEDELTAQIDAAYKSFYAAKDAGDKETVVNLMAQIKQLKAQLDGVEKQIKTATDKNSLYNRAAKPYLDAKKLLAQAENYRHYDEIAAMYEQAKQRSEEEEKRLAEEEARKTQAEKEHAAAIRAERKAARKGKK